MSNFRLSTPGSSLRDFIESSKVQAVMDMRSSDTFHMASIQGDYYSSLAGRSMDMSTETDIDLGNTNLLFEVASTRYITNSYKLKQDVTEYPVDLFIEYSVDDKELLPIDYNIFEVTKNKNQYGEITSVDIRIKDATNTRTYELYITWVFR